MKKEARLIVKKLAKLYGVNLRIVKLGKAFGGFYYDDTNTIVLNSDLNCRAVSSISCFFHELGHKHCVDNDIWKSYHESNNNKIILKTALKAEYWVDDWAKKEYKKHFPKGYRKKKYVYGYEKKEHDKNKNFLKAYYQ